MRLLLLLFLLTQSVMARPVTSSLPVFQGEAERKGSAVFMAPPGWRFRYSVSGGSLKILLFDSEKNQVGESAWLKGGGSGERLVGKAGKYSFMIQSRGRYKIEVLTP